MINIFNRILKIKLIFILIDQQRKNEREIEFVVVTKIFLIFQLQQVGRKSNDYNKPSTYVFTVTQGTTTTKGSSGGGSSSHTVSANVGLNIKSVFSADLGYSQTTSYDWNESSSTSFAKTVSHQVEVDVQPGDTVTVYQVVGICDNSDGNKYVIETNTLVVKGKKTENTIEVN